MRKYLYVAKITVAELAAYPTRFFSSLLVNAAALFVSLLIWLAIFKTKNIFQGYELSSIVTYYALTFLLTDFTSSWNSAQNISDYVHQGEFSALIIKPFNFHIYIFVKEITQKLFYLVLPLLLIILAISFSLLAPPVNLSVFFLSAFLAIILNHFNNIVIGAIAFWATKTWGFISIYGRFTGILKGTIFPLDFLPRYFLSVVQFLPFQYMHFAIISIYLGKVRSFEIYQILGMQIIWIILLFIITNYVWRKGVKHYDAVGH